MVSRAIIAEAAENVLSTDETLKATIEGNRLAYALRWTPLSRHEMRNF